MTLHRAFSVSLLLILAASGCSSVNWRYSDFDSTQAAARGKNQLTFVYFRSWVSLECTHFEDEVLHNPDVTTELRETTNLMLEHGPLAVKWGLKCVPAFAIVAPDGRVLESATAPITAPDLVAALRRAKEAYSAHPGEKS